MDDSSYTRSSNIALIDPSSNPILYLGELWTGIPSKPCWLSSTRTPRGKYWSPFRNSRESWWNINSPSRYIYRIFVRSNPIWKPPGIEWEPIKIIKITKVSLTDEGGGTLTVTWSQQISFSEPEIELADLMTITVRHTHFSILYSKFYSCFTRI